MPNKIKFGLLISLIIFLLANIAVIFIFKDTLADSFVQCGDFCFEEDSTSLLIDTNSIFTAGEPLLPQVMSVIRGGALLISAILSIWLFIKYKNVKHLLYFFITNTIILITIIIQLETASPGIYDFFRKIKISYILGVVASPWLFYYSIIIIPVILITMMVIIDLKKERIKNGFVAKYWG